MDAAKAFFVERGHLVVETFVERGYTPDEEVQKHLLADSVVLQTPVNWFGAPWIYKKYVDEVFNAGLAKKVLLEGDGRTRQDPSKQFAPIYWFFLMRHLREQKANELTPAPKAS